MFDLNPSPGGEGDVPRSRRESPPGTKAALLTLGALLAAGCDPTSPEPPPLSVEVSGPDTTLVAPEALPGNNVACTVPLQAAAVGGRPGESARWTGTLLDLRTYDRDGELVDAPAHPMSRAWTADLWGGETLAAGDTARVEPLFHRPGQGIERWDGTVQFTWEAVGPEDPERAEERLTEPVRIDCLLDPDFDPADARYVCRQWQPMKPRADRILADVNFQQAGPGPSDEHRTRVLSAGGEIEHGFHVPVIRAWIGTDSVPTLPAVTDRVQDPDRFEVVVMVHYLRPVEPGDTVRIRGLGGAIRHVFTESPAAVSTLLPDSAIPVLRARAEVERVDPVATFCQSDA